MKKIAAITCLLLLTVGSAAAWAAICCPPDHRMMATQTADDCIAPVARATPAPVSLHQAGKENRQDTITISVKDPVAVITTPGALSAGESRPGGASPAVSQTTPVLLR